MNKTCRLLSWFPLLLLACCGTSPPANEIQAWEEVCDKVHDKVINRMVNDVTAYVEVRRYQDVNFSTGEIYNEAQEYSLCRWGPYYKTYGFNCSKMDAKDSPDIKPLQYEEVITYKNFVKDKITKVRDDHPYLYIFEIYDRADNLLMASSEDSQIYGHSSSDWGALPFNVMGAMITGGPKKECGEFLYVGDVLKVPPAPDKK